MTEREFKSQQGMLVQFFKEWQAALLRAEMAEQTLTGACNDATLKEARFKGAAELLYGSTYTFEYDEQQGLTFKAATDVLSDE